MAQASQFVISEFTNPSGEIIYRVAGWLDGKRIRKNFPTRADAVAERQILDIQRVQSETGVRTAATRLTDEQLHEAEAACRRRTMPASPAKHPSLERAQRPLRLRPLASGQQLFEGKRPSGDLLCENGEAG